MRRIQSKYRQPASSAGNATEQVMIGFDRASHWLRKRRSFYNLTERRKRKQSKRELLSSLTRNRSNFTSCRNKWRKDHLPFLTLDVSLLVISVVFYLISSMVTGLVDFFFLFFWNVCMKQDQLTMSEKKPSLCDATERGFQSLERNTKKEELRRD